jgi:uncharacterized membrane protein YdbT with pleckstrin-like domain
MATGATLSGVAPVPAEPPEEKPVWSGGPTLWLVMGSLIKAIVAGALGVVLVVAAMFTIWYLALAGALIIVGAVLYMAMRILATKMIRYRVTTQRVLIQRGILNRRITEMELFRVKDTACQQSATERMLGFGDIQLVSTDSDTPVSTLVGVSRPLELKEKIRNLVMDARRDHRVLQMSQ